MQVRVPDVSLHVNVTQEEHRLGLGLGRYLPMKKRKLYPVYWTFAIVELQLIVLFGSRSTPSHRLLSPEGPLALGSPSGIPFASACWYLPAAISDVTKWSYGEPAWKRINTILYSWPWLEGSSIIAKHDLMAISILWSSKRISVFMGCFTKVCVSAHRLGLHTGPSDAFQPVGYCAVPLEIPIWTLGYQGNLTTGFCEHDQFTSARIYRQGIEKRILPFSLYQGRSSLALQYSAKYEGVLGHGIPGLAKTWRSPSMYAIPTGLPCRTLRVAYNKSLQSSAIGWP